MHEVVLSGASCRALEHGGRSVDCDHVRAGEPLGQLARADTGSAADVEHAPDGRRIRSAQLVDPAGGVGDEAEQQLAFELGVHGQRFPVGFVEVDVSVAVRLVCSHERDGR